MEIALPYGPRFGLRFIQVIFCTPMPASIDNIGSNIVVIVAVAILVCAVLAVLVYQGKIRQKGPHNRNQPF